MIDIMATNIILVPYVQVDNAVVQSAKDSVAEVLSCHNGFVVLHVGLIDSG